MKAGEFRKDLFFRLKTHYIHIPPLRQRKDDITLLLDNFAEKAARTLEKPRPRIPLELPEILSAYEFPGNIRELQSMVFDAISRCTSDALDIEFFRNYVNSGSGGNAKAGSGGIPSHFLSPKGSFPTLHEVEEFFITEAMQRTGGNQTLAAQLLGIAQSTLSRRYKNKEPRI